jgi:hypothetical protein
MAVGQAARNQLLDTSCWIVHKTSGQHGISGEDFGEVMLNEVARFFLRAKNWQLFALLIGTAVAGFVGFVATAILLPPTANYLALTLTSDVSTLPFLLCLLAWWWSAGTFLNSLIPPRRELKVGLFHFALTVLLVSSLLNLLFPLLPKALMTAAAIPISLFLFFCVFYVAYFLSKSLVIKNKGKDALGDGEVLLFFLFLFFPIGVWSIQPRVNQLYAAKANA